MQLNAAAAMDDSKYHKHQQQKASRRRRILQIAGIVTFVLTWTWLSLHTAAPPLTDQLQAHRMTFEESHRQRDKPAHAATDDASFQRIKQLRGKRKRKAIGKAADVYPHADGNRDDKQDALMTLLDELDHDIRDNARGGPRWIPDHHLISLDKDRPNNVLLGAGAKMHKAAMMFGDRSSSSNAKFFRVERPNHPPMRWEKMMEHLSNQDPDLQLPLVDYTRHNYDYVPLQMEPQKDYPQLSTMGDLQKNWPQDNLDTPPPVIQERLMHFDFTNQEHREAAIKYRDAKLPFKVTNVPELLAAGEKWTDTYLADNFGRKGSMFQAWGNNGVPLASGSCQESRNNFFSFFTPPRWEVDKLGLPPTRQNDWDFERWVKHARFADVTKLQADQPHFYFQAGVDKEERYQPYSQWNFISRDLPSFSARDATFFQFVPEEQKGIQCRFGERGVTAATHYDGGRNMVAMIQGAKRYILSPPDQCPKLGIVTQRGNPVYRHSLLNFGHMQYDKTPPLESQWLQRSASAQSVETVLKAGEVLYIPSHWFHYITSLQKSAQCNVRSGIDREGTPEHGGLQSVTEDCDPLRDAV